MEPFTRDDWAELDADWRRLLAPAWAELERPSEAQLAALRRRLRDTTGLAIGDVHGRWTSPTLAPLRRFAQLRALALARPRLLPTDLPALAESRPWTDLRLEVYGDSGHSPYDLRPLAALGELRSLCTRSMPLTGLDALAECTQLRELSLEHLGVCGVLAREPRLPLERLRKLEHLRVVGWLGGLSVEPHALVHLGQLRSLALGDTPGAPIREAAALAGLSLLQWLDLSRTQLGTLGGLIDAPLEHLEELAVPESVPVPEARAFSRTHPRCLVIRHDRGGGGSYQAGRRLG